MQKRETHSKIVRSCPSKYWKNKHNHYIHSLSPKNLPQNRIRGERYYDTLPSLPASKAQDLTFSSLLTKWLADRCIELKKGTITKYQNLIETHIRPELGNLRMNEITVAMINSFLLKKLQHGRVDGKGGLSPGYVCSISLIISSALNYGVSQNICPQLEGKIFKPTITKKEPTVLSRVKQQVLEDYIIKHPSPTAMGVMISLYSGLRIGEICALKWSDVDFSDNAIHVRHTLSRVKTTGQGTKTQLILDEPKTASSKRCVPIPPSLSDYLKQWRRQSRSPYVVSTNESFVSTRTFEDRFRRLLLSCEIEPINYHVLRHTFATRCVEVGVDTKTLSEILGHSGVALTLSIYVHSSFEMKKKQLEKLSCSLPNYKTENCAE